MVSRGCGVHEPWEVAFSSDKNCFTLGLGRRLSRGSGSPSLGVPCLPARHSPTEGVAEGGVGWELQGRVLEFSYCKHGKVCACLRVHKLEKRLLWTIFCI